MFKRYGKSSKWKEWISIRSMVTCMECRDLHGKIIGMTESFEKNPPIHIKCKCLIRLVKTILAGTATEKGANGADWYLKYVRQLPPYYISKLDAIEIGWNPRTNTLEEVAPEKMIGGDEYYNREGKLPVGIGRKWYEADINYKSGSRNSQRILYSNDGLIFVTYNHYDSFIEIT